MKTTTKRALSILAVTALLVGLGYAGAVAYDLQQRYPQTRGSLAASALKTQLERGRYIADLADCVACHSAPGGQPFAGGYRLETPFGPLLSSNITSDPQTGIGGWTQEQFDRAVRHGKGSHGYLYPAMPYTAYGRLTDQDLADLWQYIRTLPPVSNAVVENQLPFPFDQRWLLAGWNLLFFRATPFEPDPRRSDAFNRGDYLVNGPGHCTVCHTAVNFLGGDSEDSLQGAVLAGWHAPDLTGNLHTGLGHWTTDDIVLYLKTGTNRLSVASGPMTEAIENSTQYLTEEDLAAIAEYLKTLPASVKPRAEQLSSVAPAMVSGKRIYDSQCSACHVSDGSGVRQMIPTLAGNPVVNARDPASLLRMLLNGSDGPRTAGNPTGAGMPALDWRLADDQVAAVLTYIRNTWGNAAPGVDARQAEQSRQETGARPWAGG